MYPFRTAKAQNIFDTENTEGTEFYFVNSAIGAVNNKKVFSVSSVFSVTKSFFERALIAEIAPLD